MGLISGVSPRKTLLSNSETARLPCTDPGRGYIRQLCSWRGLEDGQMGIERFNRKRRGILELWPVVVRGDSRANG